MGPLCPRWLNHCLSMQYPVLHGMETEVCFVQYSEQSTCNQNSNIKYFNLTASLICNGRQNYGQALFCKYILKLVIDKKLRRLNDPPSQCYGCHLPCGITVLPVTWYKWTHHGRYSIYLSQSHERLSYPRWLVTYRDGLPAAHRRSSIQVVTKQHTAGNRTCNLYYFFASNSMQLCSAQVGPRIRMNLNQNFMQESVLQVSRMCVCTEFPFTSAKEKHVRNFSNQYHKLFIGQQSNRMSTLYIYHIQGAA